MPYTINGVGTWYYGRSRVHTLRDSCEFCGAFADLSSYDTTHYFVLLFIPLIPLGRYRILNECSHCRKHRAMKLSKWEEAKQQSIADVHARLREKLDDPDAVKHAIEVATIYQDEKLFLRVAEHLAAPMANNADIQRVLGSAYGYFARSSEAEQAYRRSLQLREDPDVRRFMAMQILRQGRPDEAEAILRPILEQRDAEHVGLLMLLIEGYQAQPNHTRAIELLDQCVALNPGLAADKGWSKFQKQVHKAAKSGKVVAPSTFNTAKAGYHERAGSGRLARWIGPAVAALAVIAYFAAAWYQGQHRAVFVVNGTKKPYALEVNGSSLNLPALSHRKIEVPEGAVTLATDEPYVNVSGEPLQIVTPFWVRPFLKRTFIINPDRTALISWQRVSYGHANPAMPEPEFQLHAGDLLYKFSGVDYTFEQFPQQIQVGRRSGSVKKTRVATISPAEFSSQDLFMMTASYLGPQQAVEHLRRRVQFDPDDEVLLGLLVRFVDKQAVIDMLERRLNERATLVAWHRTYQHVVQLSSPERDIVAEYRTRLAQDPGDPALAYLLGRLVADPDESRQLFERSVAGANPCAYGHQGLAAYHLTVGNFDSALTHVHEAIRSKPGNELFLNTQREVWLAMKRYDDLLTYLRQRQTGQGYSLPYVLDEVQVMAFKGDRAGAEQRVQRFITEQTGVAGATPDARQAIQLAAATLRAALAYAAGDVESYSAVAREAPEAVDHFQLNFTTGDLHAAEQAIAVSKSDEKWPMHLLLFLAHDTQGASELASRQLELAVKLLRTGDQDERVLADTLAADGNGNPDRLTRITLRPEDKSIALLALAVRYPDQRDRYLDLARKLNYSPSFPRLFLTSLLDGK